MYILFFLKRKSWAGEVNGSCNDWEPVLGSQTATLRGRKLSEDVLSLIKYPYSQRWCRSWREMEAPFEQEKWQTWW